MEKLAIARFQYVLACDFPELRIKTTTPSPAMDPTTLVTFLFRAPPEARTVELLGSWDNFQQAYCMHHDRRRGVGFWSGCFEFQNIIFDGDSSSWNNRPRTGGLKQGGTYWYYYRLDDETEAVDVTKELSTSCPLLPGQSVNLLEVPTELVELPSRRRSASVDVIGTLASLPSTHTLKPDDKFARLEPPPVSKVHGRCISDLALNGRPESNEPPKSSVTTPKSTHVQSNNEEARHSQRYYADFSYYDDRSSVYSRQSSFSTAPSFAHSYAENLFGVESPLFDEDFSIGASQTESEWPLHSFGQGTANEESNLLDSDLNAVAASHIIGSCHEHEELQDSMFDFQFGGSRLNLEPLVEEDSPRPSVESNSCLLSSHIVQGSRSLPTTSYTTPPQRPRLYSLPTTDFSSPALADLGPRSPTSPPPLTQQDSLESDNYIIETTLSLESSNTHDDAAELWSPTYSAATASSGGLNTPYRLSSQYTQPGFAYANGALEDHNSLESVAERLRHLRAEDTYGVPTPILEAEEPPLMFTGYALPDSEAVQSTQTLGKLSSAHTSIAQDLSLPSLAMLPNAKEDSFADSIFSELGYLGEQIV